MAAEVPQQAGHVDFGDTSFKPDASASFDPVRRFMMFKEWPSKPFSDRKFQLGGKERIALLTESPYMFWAHRFSQQWLGSATNGYRRCTKDIPERQGKCVCCDHYESAPEKIDDKGKTVKDARCGKRQQRFGMNILVYKTDLEGNLLDPQNMPILMDNDRGLVLQNGQPAELVYDVFLWVFGPDKFQKLRDTKQQWGDLRQHDYMCTLDAAKPDTFQDFDLTITPTNAWKIAGKSKPDAPKEIVTYYKEHVYDVLKLLGKEHTDDELKQFMFGVPDGQRRQQTMQAPVADVAKEIERELAGIQGGQAVMPPPPPPAPPQLEAVSLDMPVAPATPPAPDPVTPDPVTPAPVSTDFDALLNG